MKKIIALIAIVCLVSCGKSFKARVADEKYKQEMIEIKLQSDLFAREIAKLKFENELALINAQIRRAENKVKPVRKSKDLIEIEKSVAEIKREGRWPAALRD